MWVITKALALAILSLSFAGVAHASLLFPSVQDVVLQQGEGTSLEFVIQNTTNSVRQYDVDIVAVDLGAEGEYDFKPIIEEQSSWFNGGLEAFNLVAGETREFQIEVGVNDEADSQTGVFGVRIVESDPGVATGGVQTGFISLIFLTAGDGISESVTWLDYRTEHSFFQNDVNAFLTVRNEGDRFVQPIGSITIKSWTGRVLDSIDVNPESSRAVKGQDKTFKVSFDGDWLFGPYQFDLSVQPWADGDVYEDSVTVWFFSLKTGGFIFLSFFVLILIWRYAKRS